MKLTSTGHSLRTSSSFLTAKVKQLEKLLKTTARLSSPTRSSPATPASSQPLQWKLRLHFQTSALIAPPRTISTQPLKNLPLRSPALHMPNTELQKSAQHSLRSFPPPQTHLQPSLTPSSWLLRLRRPRTTISLSSRDMTETWPHSPLNSRPSSLSTLTLSQLAPAPPSLTSQPASAKMMSTPLSLMLRMLSVPLRRQPPLLSGSNPAKQPMRKKPPPT